MTCSTEALERAVEQFQHGSDREAAFQRIFTCYFPVIRKFFARKGVPEEVCYDLTQKTLLQVYENLDGFRHESAFKTWVSTIAFNVFKRWLRRKKRREKEVSSESSNPTSAAPGREPEDPAPSQEDVAMRRERRERLRRCLEKLSARQRQSFTLYTYHELSYKEISRIMSIEVGTVGALLNQARQKVRDCFEVRQ